MPTDETLYQLPTASRRRRQDLFARTLGGLVLAALAALSFPTQTLAGRWRYAEILGPPLVDRSDYPAYGFLAVVLALGGLLAARIVSRRARTPLLLVVPLLLPAVLAGLGPFYSPLAYLRWIRAFGSHERLAPGFSAASRELAVALVVCALPVLLHTLLELVAQRDKGDVHGSARWATEDEVERTGLLEVGRGIVLGAYRGGRREHVLRDTTDRHVFVAAPSGSGKSTAIVIPTLLEWPGSAFVLDIKGELWALTAGFRSRDLGQRCLRFDPACADGTAARYNPLLAVPRTDEDVRYAQALAEVLIDPDGANAQPDFWHLAARELLVGAILHVLYAERSKTLAGCSFLLASPAEDFLDTLKRLLLTEHDPTGERRWRDPTTGEPTRTHPVVASAARKLLNLDPRTSSGVLATAQAALSLFQDPILAANTATSDFLAEDLAGEVPTSLYVTVSPSDLIRLRALLRIVVRQLTERLTASLDPRHLRGVRSPLLFLLDEFTSLGPMPFLETGIGYFRGFGIRMLISIQTIAQLHKAYGQHQAITNNCGLQVAFAPNDHETATMLSNLTGKMTVHAERRTLASHGFALRSSFAPSETPRPLLLPDEVRRLPPDECLVFAAGHRPVRAHRRPYFAVPELLALASIPPPQRSDRIERPWQGAHDVSPEGSIEATPALLLAPAEAELDRLLDTTVG